MRYFLARLFLLLFIGDAALHLYAVSAEWELITGISKTLLMPLLLTYCMTRRSYVSRRLKQWLALALLFSWGGDILLYYAGAEPDVFLFGLGSFLLAHIMYILLYGRASAVLPLKRVFRNPAYYIPIILYGVAFVVYLYPHLAEELRYAVVGYAVVLIVMLLAAAGRRKFTHPTSFIWVFVGAQLFVISDSILAIDHFVQPLPHSAMWVMSTYIAAQWMIAEGLLRHPSPVAN